MKTFPLQIDCNQRMVWHFSPNYKLQMKLQKQSRSQDFQRQKHTVIIYLIFQCSNIMDPRNHKFQIGLSCDPPLPLMVLPAQSISVKKAQQTDFSFFDDMIKDQATPEFGGCNPRNARKQISTIGPQTQAVCLPLIDMTPAAPTTMMTAMSEAQRLTKSTGQIYTVFTNDRQLYRPAVHVM